MLASTFMDMVLGVDIHFEIVPMSPAPVPLPNPFVGMVFDPAGLLVSQAMSLAAALVSGTLYRMGTLGRSEADAPQFWAFDHPLSPGYASKYGIPAANVANADFIETAVLKPGSAFVTRPAPAVGANLGGGIEVVVAPGDAQLQSFSTKGSHW